MTMLPMPGQQNPFASIIQKIQQLAQNAPVNYPGYDAQAADYPTIEIPDSYNPSPQGVPNIPESYAPQYGQQTEPVPMENSPGPSVPTAPTSEPATHKKRGLLGSIGHVLGNVFMPEPDSLYAAALRGGIWDAKANQQDYRYHQNAQELAQRKAELDFQRYATAGEFKVVGNNILHIKPDGTHELITPPQNPGDKERMFAMWQQMSPGPEKDMLARMLLGANSDPALSSRERIAGTRAGATLGSARIRASASGKGGSSGGQKNPPQGFIVDK